MKLSESTVNVLKNFSSINPSILFKPGNVISTITPTKTVMAIANVAETFEVEAGIYELSKFIGVLSLFNEPELKFSNSKIDIKTDKRNLSYVCANPEMIIYPSKSITMPDIIAEFTLPEEEFIAMNKAVSVLQLPEIIIESEDNKIFMAATTLKNPTSYNYKVELGETDKNIKAVIKTEYFSKLMPNDYVISITDKNICSFKSDKITYYVALESV